MYYVTYFTLFTILKNITSSRKASAKAKGLVSALNSSNFTFYSSLYISKTSWIKYKIYLNPCRILIIPVHPISKTNLHSIINNHFILILMQ